ncbi:Hypothetical protein A7982_01111 [Minicystis rosea]|nr:Hypothetical protein A7982_01111 [Minicystis rosea]
MSYSVHVFPRALEAAYEEADDPSFFEDDANLVAFDAAVLEHLVSALERSGFIEGKKTKDARHFANAEWPATALLTPTGLYLSASGVDGIFEIGMFASELADDTLAKFDPHEGAWE